MRSSSSASGSGNGALYGLFIALSLLAGILVVAVLWIATSPIVALFPPDSGAQEIMVGISLIWGIVAGCMVAVFTIGASRRMHVGAQFESIDEAEALPLEMIGRPIGPSIARRRAANDRRARAVTYAEDDDDELLLDEEAELPRRRGSQRVRR